MAGNMTISRSMLIISVLAAALVGAGIYQVVSMSHVSGQSTVISDREWTVTNQVAPARIEPNQYYPGSPYDPSLANKKFISVSGIGLVNANPDKVIINVGVDTRANTAQEALANNTKTTNGVITELKGLGIKDNEIATQYFNIYPQFNYKPDGSPPELAGYQASNTVSITLMDLSKTGEVIDTSVKAGANRIDNIFFTIDPSKTTELRDKAIEQALDDARAKAEVSAKKLGVSIVGVQNANVYDNGPYYGQYGPYGMGVMAPMAQAQLVGGSAAIIPNQIQISVNVNVMYEIQ